MIVDEEQRDILKKDYISLFKCYKANYLILNSPLKIKLFHPIKYGQIN